MDIWKLMEERHSVRQYTDQPISPDLQKKIRALVEEVNQESGLDIQVLFDEPTCFDSARARYGKFFRRQKLPGSDRSRFPGSG